MKFETLEDYDNYLNGIKEDLNEIEEYLKEHPESLEQRATMKQCNMFMTSITATNWSLFKT